jgi:hypothetical protein
MHVGVLKFVRFLESFYKHLQSCRSIEVCVYLYICLLLRIFPVVPRIVKIVEIVLTGSYLLQ